jgi:methyl-accepting chemotaxis protein
VEVKNGVDVAVDKMDGSMKSVDSCVQTIKENGSIFSAINEQAEQLKDIVADVTRSVKVMTESSSSFERTMQEINEVSQEFSTNAQDVSASSEEQVALTEEIISFAKGLASMSEELSSLINKFKL